MSLKQEIINFAKTIGLDKVGFTTAEPFLKEKEILLEKKANNLISPFEEQDIDLRCNPERLLPGVKTIICFAISYLIYPYCPSETDPGQDDGRPRGKISRYAYVNDYHFVLSEKLKEVVAYISEKERARFKIMIDTGELIEKAAAQRAGLGWIGQNTCLFTQEFGSWVFLGEILTDIELEPDSPKENRCSGCGRCVKACPTGALMAPFKINPYRCLSYITQKRGLIPREFMRPLGNRIFGCDTCQEACPNNKNVIIPNHREFISGDLLETDLLKLVTISKSDFNRVFKNRAAGWRGRNVIRRNAVCALGNNQHTYSKNVFQTLTKDSSEIVREQARLSLRS
ncbi:MAG: tRNA epoxyqueuosine(34) reductase QueG [Tepidanaerobacteraceae bacterium]|jgi:epoxyqueuosine reductase|nr:tRNA epoxyqueuosine(34) reductase QueG [Thermoanaerobacterales bacterium]